MKQADRIYYGGDYNPDQWDEATIAEDMRLFKKAGINLLTLPVFSWAKLEPDEGVYDFEWLDRIIDQIWANGIYVCLATPTTAQPAWLSQFQISNCKSSTMFTHNATLYCATFPP